MEGSSVFSWFTPVSSEPARSGREVAEVVSIEPTAQCVCQ
jgi:hypothetical protein